MYFVKDLGVGASKAELKALLSFVGKEGRLAEVSITIKDSRLLVWATDGHCGAYNHGSATDGKGGKYQGEHTWQIHSDAIEMIHNSMDKKDEVIFILSKRGELTEARVRDIESSEERLNISVREHVSEQLGIDMPAVVPERPDPVSRPVPQFGVAPFLLKKLSVVAKAAGCDCCRMTVADSGLKPIFVEIDAPGRLADSEQPCWVIVLMPLRIELDKQEAAD